MMNYIAVLKEEISKCNQIQQQMWNKKKAAREELRSNNK